MGAWFRARFARLATDDDFRTVVSFREHVLFTKDTPDAEDDRAERVPKTEFTKFFDILHSNSICSILKAGDIGMAFKGRPSKLIECEYNLVTGLVRESVVSEMSMTLRDVAVKTFGV